MSDACNINTQLANEIADVPIKGELRKEFKAYDMAAGMFKFLVALAPALFYVYVIYGIWWIGLISMTDSYKHRYYPQDTDIFSMKG